MRVTVLGAGSWGTTVAALMCRHEVLLWARERRRSPPRSTSNAPTRRPVPGCAPARRRGCPARRTAGRGRSDRRLPGDARTVPAAPGAVDPDGEPQQGARARHAPAHDRGDQGGAARTAGRHRAQPGAGDPGRPGGGQRDRDRGPDGGRGAAARGRPRRVPRLHHHDVIGCEVGGALKNVIAIATGMAQGLGVGDNARRGDVPRSGRAHHPGRGDGRRGGPSPGWRHGRPGRHVHEPAEPQPPCRRAARRGGRSTRSWARCAWWPRA